MKTVDLNLSKSYFGVVYFMAIILMEIISIFEKKILDCKKLFSD